MLFCVCSSRGRTWRKYHSSVVATFYFICKQSRTVCGELMNAQLGMAQSLVAEEEYKVYINFALDFFQRHTSVCNRLFFKYPRLGSMNVKIIDLNNSSGSVVYSLVSCACFSCHSFTLLPIFCGLQ